MHCIYIYMQIYFKSGSASEVKIQKNTHEGIHGFQKVPVN